ncbi:MAG: hypothetical protein ACK46X_00920 [Candidatus Sericytochromatia bacterium]
MRHGYGLLLTCILVAGCAAPSLTGAPPANQPAAGPLGGLTFKPVSAQNTRYIGASGGTGSAMPVPGAAATSAPTVTPSASTISPGGVASGNIYGGGYGYGYYGGSSVPMALVSVTEAEAPGSRGPLKAILEALVAPVLKDWAADAHLVSSSGSLDAEGMALVASPSPMPAPPGYGYYGGYDTGWRLSYVSPSRQEALNFHVAADKTLVIRMRWAPLNLAATPIMVDADEAVKKLSTAIEDPAFRGEEEKTGTDYFFGTAFQPVPTVPPGGYQERVETIYDVPPQARWNATLQSVLGKQVWELSYYRAYSETDPYPQAPDHWFDNSARGMVDAQTGAVVRFTRPSKRYYPNYPSPMPPTGIPSPIAPTMTPSPPPPPSPTTAPSVTPSA